MLHKIGILGQVGHIIFPFDHVDSHRIHLAALRLFQGLRLDQFLFHLKKIDATDPGDFPQFATPNFIVSLSLKQLKEEVHVVKLASFGPI
jgi:hypothetical protein